MLGYWSNLGSGLGASLPRTISPVDELRRRMENAIGHFDEVASATDTNWRHQRLRGGDQPGAGR